VKFSVCPESLVERLALWFGQVPVPLFETHISATLARTIMAGVELEIFECLEPGTLSAIEIAKQSKTNPSATTLLLDALVASGYLTLSDGRYALTFQSRKWLLRSSKNSVRDKILLQAIEWRWLTHLEEFVRTGQPLDFHTTMSDTERDLYHRSMRAIAGIAGREVGWRTPVPRNARQMIDLGGSHGHFAASICRNHPLLNAQVLDLPEAIEKSAPLLSAERLGARVVHIAGDVTLTDFGSKQYDLVFMSNLAHHLSEKQNVALAKRIARALRPGGIFVIQEAERSSSPGKAGQTGTLLGLYFALQSKSDVTSWTMADMRSWQTEAGLKPLRARHLQTAPGWVQLSAYA
jgi:2-polyprenyl-3-methyl-5-hydroxy-6-metoxy-1,4-benzoquinol methylase